ncbi:MAG: DUF4959 domain-containing protein, partial [Prevotellaceae bacterium]|nr:DUF4959 domain-containing protein [Prevotellaceae bacterium]
MKKLFDMNKRWTGAIFALAAGLFLFAACTEDNGVAQKPSDSVPPHKLSVIGVESTPGGGIIVYSLPDEIDISYVKGEYMFQGKKRVIRASVYNNFLTVEGLGSVEPIEVTLYVVDHSENVSEPEIVRFTPDTPPVESILSSLEMIPDFAGVHLTWDNPLGIEIGLTLFATDSTGTLAEVRTEYTPMRAGNFTFRGFDTSERKFAVKIIDKWGNETDMKEAVITPYFEEMLNNTLITQVVLPYDNNTTAGSTQPFGNAFDGNISTLFHTAEGTTYPLPLLLTMNLGTTAKLSRFVLVHRNDSRFDYTHHNIRYFELWGTTTVKTGMPDDYWWEDWKQDWEMLDDYEVI